MILLFTCSAHSFLLQNLSIFLVTLVLRHSPFIVSVIFLLFPFLLFTMHLYGGVVVLSDLLFILLLTTSYFVFCIQMKASYSVILAPTSPFYLFFRACVFCGSKIMSFSSHISPFMFVNTDKPGMLSPSYSTWYAISQSPSTVRTICSSS